MRRLWDEIDLHIVPILVVVLLLTAPALRFGWWPLAVPLLVPQGRIYVGAFWDYPAFGRRSWAYLAANELVVVGSVGVLAGLRVAVAAT